MKVFLVRHKKLLLTFAFIALVVLFYRCPVKLLFGIDCPSCGMTRAFLAALRLDFRTAFELHPLFLPIGIEVFYVIFRDYIIRLVPVSKRLEEVICVISIILLLIVWIFRQFIK